MSLGLLAAGVSVGAVAISSPLWLKSLAKSDILVTEIEEGSAKAIMKSESFLRFVMSFEDHHLNDPEAAWYDDRFPEWEVHRRNPSESASRAFDNRSGLMHWLGLYFVGIPPFRNVHTYEFKWNEMKLNMETHKEDVWSRDCPTDFIYVKDFAYVVVLDGAETEEGIPLDVQYQLVVKITNPYKALFKVDDWMQVLTGIANRRARNYIGGRGYDQLLSETDKKDEQTDDPEERPDDFSHQLVRLNDRLTDDSEDAERYERGLRGRYGITVVSANLQTLEVTGPLRDKIVEASVQRFTADREAYSIRALGQANADATLAEGGAEATVISLKGRAEAKSLMFRLAVIRKDERGALLAQLDAMSAEGPGRVIVWANNPFIGERPELLKAIEAAGIRSVEDLKHLLTDVQDEGEAA